MTREEIERDYNVVDGRICSPGKFEGEMVYAPFYYQAMLEGMADHDDGPEYGFDVSPEDRREFPELGDREKISFYERDDGFVCEI
jgi:hypothetical protein